MKLLTVMALLLFAPLVQASDIYSGTFECERGGDITINAAAAPGTYAISGKRFQAEFIPTHNYPDRAAVRNGNDFSGGQIFFYLKIGEPAYSSLVYSKSGDDGRTSCKKVR